MTDIYTGDVNTLTERLLASDLSLVVYYAPWDRDSQLLRWELEKAARYHHEQVRNYLHYFTHFYSGFVLLALPNLLVKFLSIYTTVFKNC